MYLHLGNQVIALQKSVLGVFDMDTAGNLGRVLAGEGIGTRVKP